MNDACCSRPVVKSSYEPVGKFETLNDGVECYTVGPAEATRGIIILYDAFGYTQQQKLGADILAANLSARVFIPDFFRGFKFQRDIMSQPKEQIQKAFGEFFAGPGNFDAGVSFLQTSLIAELKQKTPSATKWATLGFCWGGKVVAMSSGKGALVDASGACHPGRLDPAEARGFTVPHICLLSGEDGSPEERVKYKKALGESGQDTVFDVYEDQVHGWMAARANLEDEKIVNEFNRGYEAVSDFFKKHL